MKKLLIFCLLIVLPFLQLFSQHCPWDFSVILVVEVKSHSDSASIRNLEVTLIDSLGNDVMIELWDGEQWISSVSTLWENPSKTTYHDVNPVNPKKFRFWFAEDNYVLFCNDGIVKDSYKIKILDVDGKQNQGKFKPTVVEIRKEDFYPLCTNYSKWDFGEKRAFIKDYKPVKIILSME